MVGLTNSCPSLLWHLTLLLALQAQLQASADFALDCRRELDSTHELLVRHWSAAIVTNVRCGQQRCIERSHFVRLKQF